MQIKQITYHKEFKKGLPNFSNMAASMDITVEYKEDEERKHQEIWEQINAELNREVQDIDPEWIRTASPTKKAI